MTVPQIDQPETLIAELLARVEALEAKLNAQAEQLHQQELALRVIAGLPDQQSIPTVDTVCVSNSQTQTPPIIPNPSPRSKEPDQSEPVRDIFFEFALNFVDQPLIGLNADRTVRLWNQAACNLFGWSQSDVLSCRLPFIPLDQLEDFEEYLEDAQLGSAPHQWDFPLLTSSGERKSFRLRAIPGPDRTLVITLSPEEYRQAQLPPRQLRPIEQRFITLGRLTASVTHDLNNLLAIVQGNAELLATKLLGLPVLSRTAQDLLATSTAAVEVCRQLTSIVRQESQLPNRCDLISTLQRLQPVFRAVVGSKVQLGIELPKSVCVIGLSATDTLQLVLNLLTNACSAVHDIDCPQIEIRVEILGDQGSEVALSILDNGHGFDVRNQQMMMTEDDQFLHGVGMSTVRYLVEQAFGTILIESEVGQGTLVRIQFPRV